MLLKGPDPHPLLPPNSLADKIMASKFAHLFSILLLLLGAGGSLFADTLRKAKSLESLLKDAPKPSLLDEIRLRGDAKRGAILFHTSSAACVRCHAVDTNLVSVGPRLSGLRSVLSSDLSLREYLLSALLEPSRDIRPEFRIHSIRTLDEETLSGLVVEENDKTLVLRSANDLNQTRTILQSEIESRSESKSSLMPEGLIGTLRDQGEFYDLAAYVFAVVEGGIDAERELTPAAEQLAIQEDWLNLNHKGILNKLAKKDFEAGKAIYQGYCIDCHGKDGNQPNLPTARAFGKQPLKFGSDPYRMFLTITKGNGLMGSMRHLTPYQRYQVIHYIRDAFMKGSNPDYATITPEYLDSLPVGTEMGDEIRVIDRDYGAALGSQLRREYHSVLTTSAGPWTLSYDLHTMDLAGAWKNAFLDLSDTQHQKGRGEGAAEPGASLVDSLMGWQWGHDGTLDYDRSRRAPRGPMPREWMRYHGYYRHGREIMLSYEVDRRSVLERSFVANEEKIVANKVPSLRKRLRIGPGRELILAIAKWSGATTSSVQIDEKNFSANEKTFSHVSASRAKGHQTTAPESLISSVSILANLESVRLEIDTEGRLVWRIPSSQQPIDCEIDFSVEPSSPEFTADSEPLWGERIARWGESELEARKEGPTQWKETLRTVGYLGLEQEGYALDTITIPSSNPWNAWLRTAAIDFFPDGRMLVTTYGGDVWLVSGIDASLEQIEWKRFASGLYEPLGIKIIDEVPYVTCKDRIVKLHDTNGDDEADFYENFFDDPDVSTHFHAFNFDLQVDRDGWLVYAKGGHGADYSIPGAILRVSPDGQRKEEYATGFRVPNGMGILPDGRMTCSDNQGQWMPASKINLLKRGGYYGWVPTYGQKGKWSADGGRIDLEKVVPPEDFDRPLVWIPHELDNSSGGQLWAGDARWGPLSGHLLHTSFGKGWMYYVLTQEVGEKAQGAIIKLPFDFRTGVMRARLNPRDGQVYAVGLQGWNGSGRIGLRDEGIQRLRYTGRPWKMIQSAKVEQGAILLEFNFPIHPASLQSPDAISAEAWNYRWSSAYGSDQYSPSTGRQGVDSLEIQSLSLVNDGTLLRVGVPALRPVDQLHLKVRLKGVDGVSFDEELFWTLHAVPEKAEKD